MRDLIKSNNSLICAIVLLSLVSISTIFPSGSVQAKLVNNEFDTTYSYKINPPENLTATAVTSTQIRLQWEDKSDTEIRYKVERKTGRGNYTEITILGANAYYYTDAYLNPGTTYYYRVQVVRSPWDSAYSNEAYTTTPLPPVNAPEPLFPGNSFIVTTQNPRMQWTETENAKTYTLQVATDAEFSNLMINELGITASYYEITSIILDWQQGYYWRVSATNMDGITTDWSVVTSFTILPDPLTLSRHCGCH